MRVGVEPLAAKALAMLVALVRGEEPHDVHQYEYFENVANFAMHFAV
jgi:hypothetical protein